MSRNARWPIVVLGIACVALTSAPARAQINDLVVQPSPSCVGEQVTIRVSGAGSCNGVVVDTGDGMMSPAQSGPLPLDFSYVYTTAGTYNLTATSTNCTVGIPGGQTTHQVNSCGPQVQLWEDQGITELGNRVVAMADDFTIKAKPQITKGFGGKLQPGNPASFFLGGKYFPTSDAEGDVFLRIDGFWVQLEEVQWDSSGSAVAVRVPDTVDCVMDQQAVVKIITSPDGLESNEWPVEFLAARETRTLTQSEVEVVECSDSANVDVCNDVTHVDSVHWFCGVNPSATLSGCHYNAWGWADVGFDTYKIELANGWVINTILFVEESGNASQVSTSAAGHASWEEKIAWSALCCGSTDYSAWVSIIGPRCIPHK